MVVGIGSCMGGGFETTTGVVVIESLFNVETCVGLALDSGFDGTGGNGICAGKLCILTGFNGGGSSLNTAATFVAGIAVGAVTTTDVVCITLKFLIFSSTLLLVVSVTLMGVRDGGLPIFGMLFSSLR